MGDGSAGVLVASYAGGEVAVLVGGDTPVLQRIDMFTEICIFSVR